MLDYARIIENKLRAAIGRGKAFYFVTGLPLSYEPSGEISFSPAWRKRICRGLCPRNSRHGSINFFLHVDLTPTYVSDPSDGKLGHLIGLNLSRAWMLRGIVSKLPANDARQAQLSALAEQTRRRLD